MTQSTNRNFIVLGLGTSLLIAGLLSPWASPNPDGLDRVAQDLKFDSKAQETPLTHKLPFFQVFEEYSLRGAPQPLATPIAGLLGTLTTFGLAWGVGQWLGPKARKALSVKDFE